MKTATNERNKGDDSRLLGLVIALIGGFLLGSAIASQLGQPEGMAQAQAAAYVEDGQVLPENEGKLVIVTGTLTQKGDVLDEQMGLTFDVPILYRVVERYELDTTVGDGAWDWVEQVSNDPSDLGCRYFTGTVMLGDFQLGEDMLTLFPTDSYYSRFREAELKAAGLNQETEGSAIYVSPDENVTRGTSFTLLGLLGDDDVRVSYRCYDTAVTPTVTLIARQSGNTLTPASLDEVSFSDVAAGTLTKAEFLESASDEMTGGNLWQGLIGAAVLLFGICQIVRWYLPKKGKQR